MGASQYSSWGERVRLQTCSEIGVNPISGTERKRVVEWSCPRFSWSSSCMALAALVSDKASETALSESEPCPWGAARSASAILTRSPELYRLAFATYLRRLAVIFRLCLSTSSARGAASYRPKRGQGRGLRRLRHFAAMLQGVRVLNRFGGFRLFSPSNRSLTLRSRLCYGCSVFAATYRAATVRERLLDSHSPRSVKHPRRPAYGLPARRVTLRFIPFEA